VLCVAVWRLCVVRSNHGFAWIGLVAGGKRWYTAPPHYPRPPEPSCRAAGDDVEAAGAWAAEEAIFEQRGVGVCVQRPREVMVVPTAWWHATCNVHPCIATAPRPRA
jgi:hypothetical protein